MCLQLAQVWEKVPAMELPLAMGQAKALQRVRAQRQEPVERQCPLLRVVIRQS